MSNPSQWLRKLPQIDALLSQAPYREFQETLGKNLLTEMLRETVQALREALIDQRYIPEDEASLMLKIHSEVQLRIMRHGQQFYKSVINGTGIVLHTNLGRAPLAEQAIEAVTETASGYFNLEYDLETGRRGKRNIGIESILKRLTGSEAALVVNNNAAAVLLALSALTSGKEVLISRGELVEVGGGFRIPEVMEASGAMLVEVGTTNKTRLSDYENAITEQTGAIIKVHSSNFTISGFTSQPSREELIHLCREKDILYLEDLGSGQLIRLPETVLDGEPAVSEILSLGADLVTFSGDKLLGGPQCGIIAGKTAVLEKVKHHPLMRAVRADKLTLAALEATLKLYENEETLYDIPAIAMLSVNPMILEVKAKAILDDLEEALVERGIRLEDLGFSLGLMPDESEAGGGSLPTVKLPTTVIAIGGSGDAVSRLQHRLRELQRPIIAKIKEQHLRIDPRTVLIKDREALVEGIVEVFSQWDNDYGK